MRRRPDEVRHLVTKNDEPFVNPRWWTMSEAERRMMAERPRVRRERALWPFTLGAMVLAVLVLAIESIPALPGLNDVPCVKQINQHLAPPVDPGDRNGLLHK